MSGPHDSPISAFEDLVSRINNSRHADSLQQGPIRSNQVQWQGPIGLFLSPPRSDWSCGIGPVRVRDGIRATSGTWLACAQPLCRSATQPRSLHRLVWPPGSRLSPSPRPIQPTQSIHAVHYHSLSAGVHHALNYNADQSCI